MKTHQKNNLGKDMEWEMYAANEKAKYTPTGDDLLHNEPRTELRWS